MLKKPRDRFLIQSAKINQIDRFNFHTADHPSSDQGQIIRPGVVDVDEVCPESGRLMMAKGTTNVGEFNRESLKASL